MITWPTYNGKLVGTVLNTSTWNTVPGIIADETRSGKLKVRMDHIKTPDSFSVVMHMTLPEYRIFMSWWKHTCRKGVYAFVYPQIDDNTGVLVKYQFDPQSSPAIKNTSGDNLEITMSWLEAT
jgi:hypothetical protein